MASKRPRLDSGSSADAPRRVTRGADRASINDGATCSKCSQPIPYLSECVMLQPCGCKMCLRCLVTAHAERGTSLLSCCCGSAVSSHKFLQAERVPDGEVECNSQGSVLSDKQLRMQHPVRYMYKKEWAAFQQSEGEGTVFVLHLAWVEKTAGQGHILIHQKIKLWHPTDQPIIGDYGKAKPKYAESNSYQLPGKESLNPDVPLCFEIGQKRVLAYFRENYIKDPFKVERSEKTVPLSKILATVADQKQEKAKILHRATSTTYDELDKAMNKEEAGEELQAVMEKLLLASPVPPEFVDVAKLTKKDRIKKLAQLRAMYFDVDEGARNRHHEEAMGRFERMYPSVSTRESVATPEVHNKQYKA